MTDSRTIDYPQLVLRALRSAIAGLLSEVAREGLPGAHHFFITYRTSEPGVELPEELHRRFPDEMTIVLQHQFWDLETDDDGFAVTLRFDGRQTRLRVPWTAMTAFADPEAEFGLQLRPSGDGVAAPGADDAADGDGDDGGGNGGRGTVIEFDGRRRRD